MLSCGIFFGFTHACAFEQSVIRMKNTPGITNKKILAGPSVCCNVDHQWSIDQVLQSGFMNIFQAELAEFTVQHYPSSGLIFCIVAEEAAHCDF